MADALSIQGKDINFIKQLGFVDPNKDGLFSKSEQRHYQNSELNRRQEIAFQNLAHLGNNDDVIDRSDLEMLRSRNGLAKIIQEDPVYSQSMVQRYAVLEQGKKEAARNSHLGEIRPVEYERILIYAQMALHNNFPDQPHVHFGIYDSNTKTIVAQFQKYAALTQDRDGTFIDRSTLGALILNLEYDFKKAQEDITQFDQSLRIRGTAYYEHLNQEEKAKLIRILRFLFPDEVKAFSRGINLHNQVISCIERMHGGPLMGPHFTEKLQGELNRKKHLASAQ